jgi:hypothetical protein
LRQAATDHVSLLIHSPPQIMPFPLDIHEELVQVPDITQPSLFGPEFPGVVWAKLPTPLPDRLVRNHDSSLRQELLYVPEARGESVVKPNGVTDDLRRKPVSAVASFIGFINRVWRDPGQVDNTSGRYSRGSRTLRGGKRLQAVPGNPFAIRSRVPSG